MKRQIIIIAIFLFLSSTAFNQTSCNADFSFTGDSLGVVNFTNLSNDQSKHFYWDFGDGTSSNYTNPIHNYPSSGEYLVKLYMQDMQNNCSAAYQKWQTVYKFSNSQCYPFFSDTSFMIDGEYYLSITDQSLNCFQDSNSLHLSDAGPAGGSFNGTTWIDKRWGHSNFIADNRYLDSTNYVFAEYMKSIPVWWDINKNYLGCSSNFEYSVIQNSGGLFVTFKAMNQNMAYYQWQILGFGNPIYLYTSYAYFNYPYQPPYDKSLVQLITTDFSGCSDTTTQQLLLRSPYNTIESINEVSQSKDISISPNPFTTNTLITLPQAYHSIALAVYDIQGKLLMQQNYAGCSQIQLNRRGLNNGLYFLKLTLDDKWVETGKVVVRE